MRIWTSAGILAAAFWAGPAVQGAPASPLPAAEAAAYQELPSGRYAVKIIGMLTTTCGRGIEAKVLKRPEVESAQVDFEKETLTLTIKLNRTLRLSALRKALHAAADQVNLGTDYLVGKITFLP
jgi:hypothetical protein